MGGRDENIVQNFNRKVRTENTSSRLRLRREYNTADPPYTAGRGGGSYTGPHIWWGISLSEDLLALKKLLYFRESVSQSVS
jgi:hypothetical protein